MTTNNNNITQLSTAELVELLRTERVNSKILDFFTQNEIQGIDFSHARFVEENIMLEKVQSKLDLLPAHISTLKQVHSKLCNITPPSASPAAVAATNILPARATGLATSNTCIKVAEVSRISNTHIKFRFTCAMSEVQSLDMKTWKYSDQFKVNDVPFRMSIRASVRDKDPNKDKRISFYLQYLGGKHATSPAEKRCAVYYTLTVVNVDPRHSKSREFDNLFNQYGSSWGVKNFTRIEKVANPANGFSHNNTATLDPETQQPQNPNPVFLFDIDMNVVPLENYRVRQLQSQSPAIARASSWVQQLQQNEIVDGEVLDIPFDQVVPTTATTTTTTTNNVAPVVGRLYTGTPVHYPRQQTRVETKSGWCGCC